MRPLILRRQTELLSEITSEVGVPGSGGLWTNVQIYTALNRALSLWAGKVQLPRLYSFADQFSAGVVEYAVPIYTRGDIEVRIRTTLHNVLGVLQDDDSNTTWISVPAGFLEPTGTKENAYFRFHTYPYAQDGQIRWWAENGPVPAVEASSSLPNLTGTIDNDDTSLTLNAAVRVGDAGWVYIEGEYLSYEGVTRGSSTTVLSNLQRGLFSSTAASHTTTPDVEFVVAVDDERLWNQLLYQTVANLHSMKVHRSTLEDRANHQQNVNYYQGMADRFWVTSGYTPQRKPRFVLDQTALGRMPWY